MDPVSTATAVTLGSVGAISAFGLNAARKDSPEAGLHDTIEKLEREIVLLKKAKEICEKRGVAPAASPPQFAAPGTPTPAAPAPAFPSLFAAPGTSESQPAATTTPQATPGKFEHNKTAPFPRYADFFGNKFVEAQEGAGCGRHALNNFWVA